MKKILAHLTYILLISFALTGCGAKVAVVVNGENITEKELKTRVSQVAARYGYNLDSPENKEMVGFLEEQVLQGLIEEKVILQAAKEMNIQAGKEDINAELNKIKDQFNDNQKYNDFLNERKFTEKDLKRYITNQLILDKLINEVTKDITTTTQDPKKYYEENKSEFYEPEKVMARNIVVKTEEEAQAIIERLDKGDDFASLAVEFSIDPSVKDNHGLIDYFDRNAMLVDEFKDAAFSLQVGQYTKQPVKTVYGYHIIKVEDKTSAKNRTYEEVEDELINRFIMEDKNEKFMEYVDNLLGKAVIERKFPETELDNTEQSQPNQDDLGQQEQNK